MDFTTNLKEKPDNSFLLSLTIPAKEIKSEYKKIIKKQAEEAEIKGFRKGSAPINLVEDKIGEEKLKNLLLEGVIKKVYPEAIKKHDLKPVIPPKVNLNSTQKGKDWEISFISAQMPEVDLGNFKNKVKEVNAKSKIWTPEKGSDKEAEQKKNNDQQIQKIIEALIKSVEVNLPDILIDEELNRKLVNLIDQVNQAGLELNQYLSTKGTTVDEIKKQFRQEIVNNWKIDLALEKIADEEEVEVTKKDTEKIENSKMNPYIAAKIIRRQKTLEYLAAL